MKVKKWRITRLYYMFRYSGRVGATVPRTSVTWLPLNRHHFPRFSAGHNTDTDDAEFKVMIPDNDKPQYPT